MDGESVANKENWNAIEMGEMIPDPELIQYACIARSRTILGQHQSEKEESMESLAAECVAEAPPNHSMFSHTVDNRSFTFLIEPPFVFFAICHHSLMKSQTLPFLRRLSHSFRHTLPAKPHFAHLSFQPRFPSLFADALRPPPPPLLPPPPPLSHPHFLKKKKSPEPHPHPHPHPHPPPLPLPLKTHRPKHVWKKHVWVLLLLDLFVCAVLFLIWLWVCSGFNCITY